MSKNLENVCALCGQNLGEDKRLCLGCFKLVELYAIYGLDKVHKLLEDYFRQETYWNEKIAYLHSEWSEIYRLFGVEERSEKMNFWQQKDTRARLELSLTKRKIQRTQNYLKLQNELQLATVTMANLELGHA